MSEQKKKHINILFKWFLKIIYSVLWTLDNDLFFSVQLHLFYILLIFKSGAVSYYLHLATLKVKIRILHKTVLT